MLLSHSLVHAGCEKLKISTDDCQLVLEEDGTEIDEDVDIVGLADRICILLEKGQCWSNPLPASPTSASVPEPNSTISLEAALSPSQLIKISKIFQIILYCFEYL